MVRTKVGCQEINFRVDRGAEHSVVTQPIRPLTKTYATIIGATGVAEKKPFCQSKRLKGNVTLDLTQPATMVITLTMPQAEQRRLHTRGTQGPDQPLTPEEETILARLTDEFLEIWAENLPGWL
ncbi:hypothetical protein AAY473_016422 [Plecturocebus cupreus]